MELRQLDLLHGSLAQETAATVRGFLSPEAQAKAKEF